jgi:hypothetical protein
MLLGRLVAAVFGAFLDTLLGFGSLARKDVNRFKVSYEIQQIFSRNHKGTN